jgi:hypothetical protein
MLAQNHWAFHHRLSRFLLTMHFTDRSRIQSEVYHFPDKGKNAFEDNGNNFSSKH